MGGCIQGKCGVCWWGQGRRVSVRLAARAQHWCAVTSRQPLWWAEVWCTQVRARDPLHPGLGSGEACTRHSGTRQGLIWCYAHVGVPQGCAPCTQAQVQHGRPQLCLCPAQRPPRQLFAPMASKPPAAAVHALCGGCSRPLPQSPGARCAYVWLTGTLSVKRRCWIKALASRFMVKVQTSKAVQAGCFQVLQLGVDQPPHTGCAACVCVYVYACVCACACVCVCARVCVHFLMHARNLSFTHL